VRLLRRISPLGRIQFCMQEREREGGDEDLKMGDVGMFDVRVSCTAYRR